MDPVGNLVIMAQPNVPAIGQNGELGSGQRLSHFTRSRCGAEAVVLRRNQQHWHTQCCKIHCRWMTGRRH